jgi:YfiH family protein
MRFRLTETNPQRDALLRRLAPGKQVIPIELHHTRIVHAVDRRTKTGLLGDGLITTDPGVVLVITVADCMPIFLWEPHSGVVGVCHSGWKGTGIAADAIRLAGETYGAQPHHFHVTLGPHIRDCCYTVDADRAALFRTHYGSASVTEDGATGAYRLSLAQANRVLLERVGVPPGHIDECPQCTCCDTRFGSFRRETAALPPDMPLDDKVRRTTVMAALISNEQ